MESPHRNREMFAHHRPQTTDRTIKDQKGLPQLTSGGANESQRINIKTAVLFEMSQISIGSRDDFKDTAQHTRHSLRRVDEGGVGKRTRTRTERISMEERSSSCAVGGGEDILSRRVDE
jgi:hypothetical protein